MAKVAIGEKWGRVECVDHDVRSTPEYAEDVFGKRYETGVFNNDTFYKLVCECGKQFEIAADRFRGKRSVKDCGCGIGDNDTAVFVGVTMPMGLRKKITGYADARGIKLSHATVRLLEAGLKVVDGENVESTNAGDVGAVGAVGAVWK